VIALVVLAIATLGFFFYVSNFGNYNKTYGAIGGVIVMLLWIWIANLSLLFGAEFDAEMERGRQLQGGIKAEESLQLPARDTRGIRKARKKEQKDIARGRAIREQATHEEEAS
jgi:membrane protein